MKFLSLFSGIGGFDLGLERAGMRCVGQVEKDEYCLAVLEHHWPAVKRIADIYDVTESDFGAVELICGGFPCQPFSFAGKKRGQKDDRYLWPEMLRVIKAYRPTWVLGENVAGIVGVELDKVLADLENEGYELQAFIIPACAVDAPHERKRVWIVARRWPSHVDDSESRGCGLLHSKNIGTATGKINTSADADRHADDTECRCDRRRQQNKCAAPSRNKIADRCKIIADTGNQGLQGSERSGAHNARREITHGSITERNQAWDEPWIEVATRLCRVDDGVSGRVDRLKALGNAVVPQIVEIIGRSILKGMI